MRLVPLVSLLTLLACGGGDEEKECIEPEVQLIVTVTDTDDVPIEGADVQLDQEPCEELGGGEYLCYVEKYGNLHVYAALLPDYRPDAQYVEIWEPEECDVFEEYVALRLSSYIGGT